MNKYGQAAVKTVELIHNLSFTNPREAWDVTTRQIFGSGTSAQKKGCPRNAFLGLCENGLVKGIKPGKYTASKKNKHYAIKAVEILRKSPDLVSDPYDLWVIVMEGDPKTPNNQMDVVIALWDNELINLEDNANLHGKGY